MKTLLAEQPLVISLMLGAFAIALLYGWLQTGKKAAAVAALIFLALIPGAWWLAATWVTDREEIKVLIYEIADAVRRNDHEAVSQFISEERPDTITQARLELPRYVFDDARVTSVRSIEILPGAYPLRAEVDLNVSVIVSDKRGQFANLRVPRRLMVQLQKVDQADDKGERWLITNYNHMPITGQPDSHSPQHP